MTAATGGAIDVVGHAVGLRLEPDAGGAGAHVDPLVDEDLADEGGDAVDVGFHEGSGRDANGSPCMAARRVEDFVKVGPIMTRRAARLGRR